MRLGSISIFSTISIGEKRRNYLVLVGFLCVLVSNLLELTTAKPPFGLPDQSGLSDRIAQKRTVASSTEVDLNSRSNRLISGSSSSFRRPIRVAYQGESGAYSHKSLREFLGQKGVIAVPFPNFDSCYQAVASKECDYALLPFENSLGGSIHENYDLMLRYDLTIISEHDFRVSHCLHVVPGVAKDDIKYAMSHSQALAQCDNYLRSQGITPVPAYDTAGSAKLLAKNADKSQTNVDALPGDCTPSNTAAIASDLAGKTYKLECLDESIEDFDSNYTRFLLLARDGVLQYLSNTRKIIACKTSIVFTLPEDSPGALYKALACFSLRDIDLSKIESRPTSANLLNYLQFKKKVLSGTGDGNNEQSNNKSDEIPRFRYCFYVDFLGSELDEDIQNALHHLREQVEFCRVLGTYPRDSKLVGPVRDHVGQSSRLREEDFELEERNIEEESSLLNVGIIGYGAFGQFLAQKFAREKHSVLCIDRHDKANEADEIGAKFYPIFEMESFLKKSDVLIIAVPLVDFESTVSSLPTELLHGKLVVEVCSLSGLPKSILLQYTSSDVDIISCNPMFGPSSKPSHTSQWDGQPMIYEKVRIKDERRAIHFLKVFERARCQMVQMNAEQQDYLTADAEFVTHLTGRLLDNGQGQGLPLTPVHSKEYNALSDVVAFAHGTSFDLFYEMFKFNDRAKEYIAKMRENLASIERKLVAKEAFFNARIELKNSDRQMLIMECKELLKDVVANHQANAGYNNDITSNGKIQTSSIDVLEGGKEGLEEKKNQQQIDK